MSVFWLTQALAYGALVFFLVPPRHIVRFLPFALVAGLLYTSVVQHLAVNVLGLWAYPPDILTVFGIPVFFVLSWFAVTLVFGYLLGRYPAGQLWIVAFFVFWTTINNAAAVAVGDIFLTRWSVPHTAMFAIFSHIVLLYLLKAMHRVRGLGAKEDILGDSLAALKTRPTR